MKKTLAPLVVLVVAALAVAGCGGGGGGKASDTTGTVDQSKVNGITVGNCLNTSDFLSSRASAR